MLGLSKSIEVCRALGDQGTLNSEYGMVVARDDKGKVRGIGNTYVDCLINTARRITGSKEPYSMFHYEGGGRD